MTSPILQPLQSVPMIGQRENAIRAGLQQAVSALSLQIYVALATSYLQRDSSDIPPSDVQLRHLAKVSLEAAQRYFEGIGVASFTEPPKP